MCIPCFSESKRRFPYTCSGNWVLLLFVEDDWFYILKSICHSVETDIVNARVFLIFYEKAFLYVGPSYLLTSTTILF